MGVKNEGWVRFFFSFFFFFFFFLIYSSKYGKHVGEGKSTLPHQISLNQPSLISRIKQAN